MAKSKAIPVPVNDDWRAESDAHTLMEAERIKSDTKRHAAATKHAASKADAFKAVAKTKAKNGGKKK